MQQNQEDLQRALYIAFQGPLRKISRNMGVPYDYVDDVIQETFFSYFRSYSLELEPREQKAILMKIVKNKSVDFYRKNIRHESVSLDAGQYGEEYETLTDQVTKDTAESVVEDEACMEIYNKLQDLKEDWREAALLYFIEERTPVEICEILKIKPTVFRMRLSRMRKYLREWLEQREDP